MAAGDFDMSQVQAQQAAKAAEPDDEIAEGLLKAYKAYKRGHYRAVMVEASQAMNVLAAEQGINGGGWA